jgi:hypothetical protein
MKAGILDKIYTVRNSHSVFGCTVCTSALLLQFVTCLYVSVQVLIDLDGR